MLDTKVFDRAGLHGMSYADVRLERRRILSASWAGGEVGAASVSSEEGTGARAVGPGGASSFVALTGTRPAEALRRAARLARCGDAAGPGVWHGEPTETIHRLPPVADMTDGEKLATLDRWGTALLAEHGAVSGVTLFLRDVTSSSTVLTSEGTVAEVEHRDAVVQAKVTVSTGRRMTSATLSAGSGRAFADLLAAEADLGEVVRTAVDLQRAPAVGAGSYDVVCDGALAGTWAHETVGHLAEADQCPGEPDPEESLAPGTRLAAAGLTIVDGPGRPSARGWVPVDDEGTVGREVTLVRDGVVEGLLHSRATAAGRGQRPTGNGRALSYRFPPIPRLRTITVAPGPDRAADLPAGIEHGLLACGYHGGQTDRWSFAMMPERCYRIVDGEVRDLVRGVVLSGDIRSSFSLVDAVGDELWTGDTSAGCGKAEQWPLPVSAWAPAIRLRGQRVHVR